MTEEVGENPFPVFLERRKAAFEAPSLLPEIAKEWVQEALAVDAVISTKIEAPLVLSGQGASVVNADSIFLS